MVNLPNGKTAQMDRVEVAEAVEKLAWALAEAIGTLKLLGVDASAAEYERTLEEVAGE
jgi:hypothetical protein